MKESYVISPWGYPPEQMLTSPDGAWTVSYSDVNEIAMGAPVSGTLAISNGMGIRRCNSSFVWADNSRYLAVPQWTKSRMQRMVVIDLAGRRACYADGEFRVLELHSFERNVVAGIDSPVHEPAPVSVDVEGLDWSRAIEVDPFEPVSRNGSVGKGPGVGCLAGGALILVLAAGLVL